jgi:hypothetical protein
MQTIVTHWVRGGSVWYGKGLTRVRFTIQRFGVVIFSKIRFKRFIREPC